jgi:hypothetical protein
MAMSGFGRRVRRKRGLLTLLVLFGGLFFVVSILPRRRRARDADPEPADEPVAGPREDVGAPDTESLTFDESVGPIVPPAAASAGSSSSRSRGSIYRKTRLLAVFTLLAALALVLTIPNAVGSHGSSFIELTTANQLVQHDNAVFASGVGPAGTGNFDPFLTLNPGGSQATESGWNSTGDGPGTADADVHYGGGRTHPLKASAIPTFTFSRVQYREFSLDGNDSGSDDFMSIDDIKIYLDTQNGLNQYVDGAVNTCAPGSFGNDAAPTASLIYCLDASENTTVLMKTQGLSSGSGQSDITVLIPDSIFPAECFYGSLTCDKWVVFYYEAGFAGTSPPDNNDYDVSAGFEEWRTRLIPVVNLTKTANTSFDRTFDWTVQKLVSTDDTCANGFVDANTDGAALPINLFSGQSDTVCWKIVSDRGLPQDANIQLTGTITITNPTGPGQVIADPIPATINSVSDVVSPGGAATVVCPVTFPFTLAAGATLTCTYSKTLSSSAAGTNTASAVVENGDDDRTYSSLPVSFDPASGTINVEDENASLDDSRALPGAPIALSGDDTRTYTEVLSCPSSRTESNTATLTETDTNTSHTDPAFVSITCHTLDVSKTANTSFGRTFDWTVKKYVANGTCASPGTFEDDTLNLDLFNGQSATVCWKIVSDRGEAQDSGFAVNGTITITNNAPIAANGVSVSDSLAGPVAATVDCDGVAGAPFTATVNVPAKVGSTPGTATCSYTASPPDATDRLNTATASLAGVDYTGTALADFGDPTVTDDTATLDDSRVPGLPGAPVGLTGDDTSTYAEILACGSSRTETNTASLTEDDSLDLHTDPAAVALTCHGLTVEKTANTSYTRTFDWTVKKYVASGTCASPGTFEDGTLNITLNVGQSATVCWKIVSTRGAAQDSEFAVNGTITLTNNAPIEATGVSVSDAVSALPSDIAATVDCDGFAGAPFTTTVNVPAKAGATPGTASCTYTANLPNAETRTNTATASLAGNNYTGTAQVVFGDPTTVIDESANLDDSRNLPGAPLALTGDDTQTYGESLPCGSSRTESNLATLTEDDSGQIRTDPAAVNLTCVQPGQGCTPGFWKNHTSVWDNIGDPVAAAAGFTTTTAFNTYFSLTAVQSGFSDTFTMLDAAGANGGGARKLARHGVSALLNEVSVNYPIPPSIDTPADDFTDLYNAIRNAYLTSTFEPLASQLAANNELEHSACPTG